MALRRASDKSSDAESSEAQVLKLQSQAGNRAVTALLTSTAQTQVQRDIPFTSKDLAKNEGFKFELTGTYGLISEKLDAYHASKSNPDLQLTLVGEIARLCQAWLDFYPGTPSDLQKAQKQVIENLQPEVQKELQVLRAEVDYIQKLELSADKGGFHVGRETRFNALGPARMLREGKYEKKGGKGGKGSFAGTSKAARDLVAKYGLTIAEIAATRIFSMPDYAYLNPSMISTEMVPSASDPKVRIKKNVEEVGNMLSQSTDEYVKKQDPKVMAEEGAIHSAMLVRGLRKLPVVKTGELYRGMRLTPAKFKEIFGGDRITSRAGFQSGSVKKDVAMKYANGESSDVIPKPTQTVSVFCTIFPSDARDISALSASPKNEHEVMFLPGAKFLIVDVDPATGDPGNKAAPATEWWSVKMVEMATST